MGIGRKDINPPGIYVDAFGSACGGTVRKAVCSTRHLNAFIQDIMRGLIASAFLKIVKSSAGPIFSGYWSVQRLPDGLGDDNSNRQNSDKGSTYAECLNTP